MRLPRLFGSARIGAAPPVVSVEIGRSVFAAWLKLAAVAIVFACLLILGPTVVMVLVGCALGGFILFGNAMSAPAVVSVVAAFLVLSFEPFAAPIHVVLLGLHLVMVLLSVVGDVPLGARVEWAVLAERVPRFLAIQIFAQLLALGGAALNNVDLTVRSLAIGASVSLAALAWYGAARVAGATR